MPTFTGGLSTNLEFKGFFLNASVYFAGGHKVFEDWAFYTQHSGVYTTLYYNGVQDMMSRWQKPGDVTDYPRMVYNATGDNASRTSTRFLYDGDYIRLKDITLGYNIPNRFVEKTGLEGIRVSLRGANLLTWVKDEGLKYDPEVRADGFTMLTTPPTKSVSFNVNLKF